MPTRARHRTTRPWKRAGGIGEIILRDTFARLYGPHGDLRLLR
jgi:hypothetical protein